MHRSHADAFFVTLGAATSTCCTWLMDPRAATHPTAHASMCPGLPHTLQLTPPCAQGCHTPYSSRLHVPRAATHPTAHASMCPGLPHTLQLTPPCAQGCHTHASMCPGLPHPLQLTPPCAQGCHTPYNSRCMASTCCTWLMVPRAATPAS